MRLFLILLFCLACFVSAASYFLLWYETAEHPIRRRLSLSPVYWRWLFLRGFAASVATQLVLYYVYAAGLFGRLVRPAPRANLAGPPLLLIHGLYHNASAWIVLRRVLRRHGLENLHAVNLNTFTRGFDHASATVKAKVRELSAAFPGSPVLLVGHSLGGLLARDCLLDPDLRAVLGGVVTLGAPHQGSRLAAFGPGPCATDILPSSPRLKRLNDDSAVGPTGVPCLSLFPALDNMVLPPERLLLPGSQPPTGAASLVWGGLEILPLSPEWPDWRQEEVAPVNHIGIIFHMPTLERAARFLREANAAGR